MVACHHGQKVALFGQDMTALGVRFSLAEVWNGSVAVDNKPERLDRMQRMFAKFKEERKAGRADCASLHGMLNFACGFTLGHSLKPLARAVADMSVSNSEWPFLSETCSLSEVLLPEVKPKVLTRPADGCRFILYTDGAFENGRAT